MSLLDLLGEQPVSGTQGDANAIANAFAEIMAVVNGGLDTGNWAAGKIFPPSKLTQESAVDGDGLAFDNASSQWKRTSDKALRIGALAGYPADAAKVLCGDGVWRASGAVYDRRTSTVDLASSAAEASLYAQTIGAGDLGTNRMLRLLLIGDYLHNNVGGDTLTPRVKFGGTTFFGDATSLGGAISANRQPWVLWLFLSNLGVTNSQFIDGQFVTLQANAAAPSVAGIGKLTGVASGAAFGSSGLGTIDTTIAQTLDVTGQWSASSANDSFRLRYSLLEIV